MAASLKSTFVLEEPFCANPECSLHVYPSDACVRGQGNWAIREDGMITSRTLLAEGVFCDICAIQMIRNQNKACKIKNK